MFKFHEVLIPKECKNALVKIQALTVKLKFPRPSPTILVTSPEETTVNNLMQIFQTFTHEFLNASIPVKMYIILLCIINI